MSRSYWGLDCASHAQWPVQRATQLWGHPQFVGRYHPNFDPDTAELAFLHGQGIPIVCIWDGDPDGRYVNQGYTTGFAQGVAATRAWKASGAPLGTAVYMDVETGFFLSGEYARGFIEGVHSEGMVPGFYLNPQFGANHSAAYQYARARTSAIPCVYWTSQNEFDIHAHGPVTEFRTGINRGDYAAVVIGYTAECVLWQTYENIENLLDLDTASERGYALMWGAAKPAPVTTLAVQTILRTVPKTNGKHAVGTDHPDGYMPVGTVLHFTPDPSPGPYHGMETTTHWVHCAVAKSLMHGWIERAKLQTVGG